MNYDAVIIGAGMSGLAAGIRLAHYGKKVCILEKHNRVGGLNSYYSRDGHKFDVGLHAVTNYVPKEIKSTPLPRLLRQLRISRDDFALCQQRMSVIEFPSTSLRFNNDINYFTQEIVENFPSQADNFQKLLKTVAETDAFSFDTKPISAREVAGSIITDPLLMDMIMCPILYYGSAQENDMDFAQFVVMFESIFCEGLARPQPGIRLIIDVLVNRLKEVGCELRLKSGVKRIHVENGRVVAVTLDNDEELTTNNILSSAGYPETMMLLSDFDPKLDKCEAGQISLVEIIAILDQEPSEIGYDFTTTFYSDSDTFHFGQPEKELVDVTCGVICCPNNFQFDEPLPESMIRITNLANFDSWSKLDPEAYTAEKAAWAEKMIRHASRFAPDMSGSIIYSDMFTPKTIRRYTGHSNGAVYGSPKKSITGKTRLENLFICGADQRFPGIIGAMLSGITMANIHILQQG